MNRSRLKLAEKQYLKHNLVFFKAKNVIISVTTIGLGLESSEVATYFCESFVVVQILKNNLTQTRLICLFLSTLLLLMCLLLSVITYTSYTRLA